jgi:hypothetical protein
LACLLSFMIKSGIVSVLVILVILGCSANRSYQHAAEKQGVKSKSELEFPGDKKICLLGINGVDTTLLEKLRIGLEKDIRTKGRS